jgi:hypothetical protein
MNEKSEELYRVLEEASRQVKEWPDWKRSEESKRELEKLARERKQTGAAKDPAE